MLVKYNIVTWSTAEHPGYRDENFYHMFGLYANLIILKTCSATLSCNTRFGVTNGTANKGLIPSF